MTENEATREMTFDEEYEILHREKEQLFFNEEIDCEPPFANCVVRRALRCIRKLLEEIQLYRAIGTVEEFKALKERVEAKKPILNNPKINEFYIKEAKLCPSCHSYINDCSGDYCRDCGQRIDWSK